MLKNLKPNPNNKPTVYISIIEGIDGSGKTTFVKNAQPSSGIDLPDDANILKLTQKYPTVYPQNWDDVDAEYFLSQMRETAFGLNTITQHMVDTYDYIHIFVDRGFLSTAVYQDDVNAISKGFEILRTIMDEAIESEVFRDVICKVRLADTDPKECAQRVVNRLVVTGTEDPRDGKSLDELETELAALHVKFLFCKKIYNELVDEVTPALDILNCDVCGESHYNLKYAPVILCREIENSPTHWYICPTLNSPMWIWIKEQE